MRANESGEVNVRLPAPGTGLSSAERVGACMLAGCLQFFVMEQVVRLGWVLPYSFAINYISDLGAVGCSPLICSPWHAWMNASFFLQGVLIASGAVLERRRFGWAGVALLLISGVALAVVAMAPEDAAPSVHVPAAGLFFVSGGLGILAVGVSRRSLLSGLVGCLILIATLAVGMHGLRQLGAVERVAAYSISGWMAGMGFFLLRKRALGH